VHGDRIRGKHACRCHRKHIYCRFAFACFTNVPDPETDASLVNIRKDNISTIIEIDILKKRLSRELNTDGSRWDLISLSTLVLLFKRWIL